MGDTLFSVRGARRLNIPLVLTPPLFLPLLVSAQIPGDASRGRAVYQEQGCARCHTDTGSPGPNLIRPSKRPIGRAELATAMWNHAPWMWGEAARLRFAPPHLEQQDAEDLYAYLYVERSFRQPGKPGRGKKLLESKKCAECHGDSPIRSEVASDPIALATASWNHARKAGRERKWPKLTDRKVEDLASYLQQQAGKNVKLSFHPLSPDAGRNLYHLRGCDGCHRYPPANRYPARTPADFIAAMWNHAEMTPPRPLLTMDVMGKIVGYLWSLHHFDERGDAEFGRRVFEKKGCERCHDAVGTGAPALNRRGRSLTGSWIISALFRNGPAMLEIIERNGQSWPRLRPTEMADLLAYLNSLKWLHTRESTGHNVR